MRFSPGFLAASLIIMGYSAAPAAYQDDCWESNLDGNSVSCFRVIQRAEETYDSESSGVPGGHIEMVRLSPKGPPAHRNRRPQVNNNVERVIARFSKTIMLDPKNDDAYFRRGIAYFYAGSLTKALADFRQASTLDPGYGYYVLWLDIVEERGNLTRDLAQSTTQIDMTKWPAPIIRLFLGQMSPAAVLAAADDPKPATKKGQVCEANFYTGELTLRQGAKEEAANLFRHAAAECPSLFVEGAAAYAELKALGVNPLVSDTTQPLKSI